MTDKKIRGTTDKKIYGITDKKNDGANKGNRGNTIESAADFVSALAAYKGSDTVFNPWRDEDTRYDIDGAAAIRRAQLEAYLTPRLGHCPYVVVAEAIGYQGGRFTGIAITCERMILGHHKTISPGMIFPASDGNLFDGYVDDVGSNQIVGHHEGRIKRCIEGRIDVRRTSRSDSEFIEKATQRSLGFNEPTDTVVWNAILENGLNPYEVLLWNIFPFHPHKAGVPLSNRTPAPAELDAGWPFTEALLRFNGQAQVLAVGQKAADTLAHYGVAATALRHPANGGANLYKEQFKAVVSKR